MTEATKEKRPAVAEATCHYCHGTELAPRDCHVCHGKGEQNQTGEANATVTDQ